MTPSATRHAPDEGVIRYRLERREAPGPRGIAAAGLIGWHAVLRQLGVVGREPGRYGGAAWGNLSVRAHDPAGPGCATRFIITASQRTGEAHLSTDDLVLVVEADASRNRVRAEGARDPSSESLSHAALYAANPAIGAVVHGHSPAPWHAGDRLGLAATPADIEYGTPRMAEALARLAARSTGAARMLGHEDGIICWGTDLDDAAGRYVRLLAACAAAESA